MPPEELPPARRRGGAASSWRARRARRATRPTAGHSRPAPRATCARAIAAGAMPAAPAAAAARGRRGMPPRWRGPAGGTPPLDAGDDPQLRRDAGGPAAGARRGAPPSAIATPVSRPHVRRARRVGWPLPPAAAGGAAGHRRPLRRGHRLCGRPAAPLDALTASVVEATGATATRVGAADPVERRARPSRSATRSPWPRRAMPSWPSAPARTAWTAARPCTSIASTPRAPACPSLPDGPTTRVGAGQHPSYQVVTGPVTWTATGTAFDTDREPIAAGPGRPGEGHAPGHPGRRDRQRPRLRHARAAGRPCHRLHRGGHPNGRARARRHPGRLLLDPWLQANGARDQRPACRWASSTATAGAPQHHCRPDARRPS